MTTTQTHETPGALAGLRVLDLCDSYGLYCGKLLADFKHDRNRHGHVFYRWLNEMPVLILFAMVILVVVKPF